MDILKENIVKFIDAMIAENYKNAHKFLGVVVTEKVKEKIKKAKNLKPFEKAKGKTKGKVKSKKKVVKENLTEDSIIDLTELLPDGSGAQGALFDFEHYHGGQNSHMYGVRSSGKIAISDIPSLKQEVSKAIKIAGDNNEIGHVENFKELYRELSKLEKRFEGQLHMGSSLHHHSSEEI